MPPGHCWPRWHREPATVEERAAVATIAAPARFGDNLRPLPRNDGGPGGPPSPAMPSNTARANATGGSAEPAAPILTLTTALHERDAYTDAHCDRVGLLSHQLGVRLGMDARQLNLLRLAARFHDIGKIGVPDSVLRHPGRLDEAQMAQMRTHPARGQRLFLATGRADAETVGLIIRHHHEAWDGSGYPDGLAGEQIPLAARILAVVDGFDAMITDRPYRDALAMEQVLAILASESGTRLDPTVHAAFAAMMADPQLQPA